MLRRLLAIFVAALLQPAWTQASGAAPALEVRGPQLVWKGEPVRLRGVAVGDPFLAREGRPLSDYSVIAHDWRANAVRISLTPSVWKTTPHPQVVARLRAEAGAALDAGMFVILDWHVIGWPDGYFQKADSADDPRDLYDSNFALAKNFWDAAAAEFAGDGGVIFELWNEPVAGKKETDPDSGQEWARLKPRFAELLSTVRAHGKNVVLATGGHWAYNLRGIRRDLLAGENVAYAWHIYAGHDENDEKLWAWALDELQTAAPVIVSEWGFQPKSREHFRGTAGTFGEKFARDFLEAKNLHSTAWCWHPEWSPVMLEPDWTTLSAMGAFVLKYLREHNPPVTAPARSAAVPAADSSSRAVR